MIKYNDNTINKWYHDGELIKVYYHGAVCYYKLTPGGQTPCFAVVTSISQYSDREFVDVFSQADDKWYKLNNLNQYEEYGVYGSSTATTYYEGKLTVDNGYEYQYSGSGWNNVGEVSGSSRVPAGYTEIEYVENSTLAYINTGFKPNQDTRIVAEMQCVTSTNYNQHFGCGQWNNYNGIRVGYEVGITGTLHVKYGTNNSWTVYSNVTGDYSIHTYDWNKNEFYVDNTLIGSVAYDNFQTTDNLGIFFVIEGNVEPSSEGVLEGRVYSFKIYDDGTLVRDLVPCKSDNDSRVGMYDIANDAFYYPPNYESYQLLAGPTVTGGTVYPMYYDEKPDPPDNLSFSSMTEAESYECPWWGMSADIDNTEYMFCEGNEWLTKYTYIEVSDDYLCDNGNKYKKMQEYDRIPDGTTTATTTYVKGDLIESASTDCSTDYSTQYLTLVAQTNNVSFSYSTASSSNRLQYSLDSGSTWSNLSNGSSTTSVNSGAKVLFKAIGLSIDSERGIGTITPSAAATVEGNIMSLCYGDSFTGQTVIPSNFQFRRLFSGVTTITSAENMVLPATTLKKQCYSQMFQGCTSLTATPITVGSSAMTWSGDYCMSNMFSNCTSLVHASSTLLPALNLGTQCYWYMFENSTSLIESPLLLATTLRAQSYQGMFNGCSSLNTITCLATNQSNRTNYWTTGVAATGTFYKHQGASWASGVNGIPNGWTVVDYSG